jgi:uncharacterized protein
MQRLDEGFVYSSSDLNDFLACTNTVHFQRAVIEGRLPAPEAHSASTDLLARKGDEHEQAYLAKLRASGLRVVAIQSPAAAGGAGLQSSLGHAARATLAAMRNGADVVYQATFFAGGWQGRADFLMRVDRPSNLGAWSYYVADTKLARRTKPYFLLQLCFYTEQVARLQGVEPVEMEVVLGTGEREKFRYREFRAYYTRVRRRFEQEMATDAPAYPYPTEHCSLCDFAAMCEKRWLDDDHLSLVAGIRREQVMRLNEIGIGTVAQLANADRNLRRVRISAPALEALQDQATLQTGYRRTGEHVYRLLEPEPERRFALLPPASPGDLFFDMEGDPYFEAGRGLEYLFGVMLFESRVPRYRAFWAHTHRDEKLAFEQFIDFVCERLKQYPDLHIYHYAHYEPTAIKRLMGEHGTREDEVDDLLRRDVFVDLYRVVRQALRISHPSYSIKNVRTFFMDQDQLSVGAARVSALGAGSMAGAVMDAPDSVLAYEHWIDTGDAAELDAIAKYNELDCLSVLKLRDWLVERKAEAEETFGREIPWKAEPEVHELDEDRAEALDGLAQLKEALLEGAPEGPSEADARAGTGLQPVARWLLAQLLDYHRREDKPDWWAYFARLEATDEELLDDLEAIAGLAEIPGCPPEAQKRSFVYTLAFPPQEHKLKPGPVVDPRSQHTYTLVDVDDSVGRLRLSVGPRDCGNPLPRAIIAQGPLQTRAQQAALMRFAEDVIAHGLNSERRYRALREMLLRAYPTVRGRKRGAVLQTTDLKEMRRLVAGLKESHLFIQGPPGSGKTWTGARLIVDLIRQDKRVGVSAMSHKAINNLLAEVERTAAEEGVKFKGLKKCVAQDDETAFAGKMIANSTKNEDFASYRLDLQLLAGTAWLFAREEMDSTLDCLFIDEAGQVSLADALAMGTCAKNLVLLGDPLQLAQVSKGVHPGQAGSSVLEYLLGDAGTIPVNRGIFLEQTRRLHPRVCEFISEVVYEGRLTSAPLCARRRVGVDGTRDPAPAGFRAKDVVGKDVVAKDVVAKDVVGPELQLGAGIRYLPVPHVGNAQRSPEEAAAIKSVIDQLLATGRFTDSDGTTRPLRPADIMVVAPYNVQVRCLREALSSGVQVGTVDKFQGRQAPIVFFSMATSSGDDLPRNLEFLFSRNRLNVAISRAQCLAIVVASPRLLDARCRTVEQMQMVNVLCRLVEVAEVQRREP